MNKFKNILCVLGESSTPDALDTAVDLALKNDAKLTLLCVSEPLPLIVSAALSASTKKAIAESAQATLQAGVARAKRRMEVDARIEEGKPHVRIIQHVLRNDCDLVIKQKDAPGASIGELLGDTDRRLLRKCPCPVWLIKPNTITDKRSFLACVDVPLVSDYGSDENEQIDRKVLELAGSLASMFQSEFAVAHAWEVPGENVLRSTRSGLSETEISACIDAAKAERAQWLEQLLAPMREQSEPKLYMRKGPAQSALVELAQEISAGTVVIGTIARSGIPGMLVGNTAEALLRKLDCSILAVKPASFTSPITLDS